MYERNNTKILELLKLTYNKWSDDNASRLAAALSYYTVFSLAPLLLISIAIAGLLAGRQAVQGRVMTQISGLLGREGAESVQLMIASAYKADQGFVASALGIAALIFGATALFVQLQDALDTIWAVRSDKTQGFLHYLKSRWLSFSLILVVGFILLVSLFLSATISFLAQYSTNILPFSAEILALLNFVISILLTSGLFAAEIFN